MRRRRGALAARTVCVLGLPREGRTLVARMLRLLGEGVAVVELDDAAELRDVQRELAYAVHIARPSAGQELGRWLRFLERALAQTADADRVVVFDEDLHADPRAQLRRLAALIGCPRRAEEPTIGSDLEQLLNGRRDRRDRRRPTADEALPLGVAAVHRLLRLAIDRDDFELVRSFATRALSEHEQRRRLEGELGRLRARVDAAEATVRAERSMLEREGALLRDAAASLRALAEPAAENAAAPQGTTRITRGEYQQLVQRVRHLVGALVPAGATVAVASRGDPELLRLDGRAGWHFPQVEGGVYAGFHPADSADAIARLEQLRSRGAGYLVFPATAAWWLEHYADLKQHLDGQHELLVDEPDTCTVYRLRAQPGRPAAGCPRDESDGALARQLRQLAADLLPADAAVAVVAETDGDPPPLDGMTTFALASGDAESPADGAEAVAHLEAARARGAAFLVVPSAVSWWLDRPELARHLDRRYRLVTRQRHVCSIFDLAAREQRPRRRPRTRRSPNG